MLACCVLDYLILLMLNAQLLGAAVHRSGQADGGEPVQRPFRYEVSGLATGKTCLFEPRPVEATGAVLAGNMHRVVRGQNARLVWEALPSAVHFVKLLRRLVVVQPHEIMRLCSASPRRRSKSASRRCICWQSLSFPRSIGWSSKPPHGCLASDVLCLFHSWTLISHLSAQILARAEGRRRFDFRGRFWACARVM